MRMCNYRNRFRLFVSADLAGISHQSGRLISSSLDLLSFSIGMFLVATLFRIIRDVTFSVHGNTLMPVSGLIRCPFAVPYMVMLQGIIIRIMEDDLIPVFQVLLFHAKVRMDSV